MRVTLICPKWGTRGLNSVPFFKMPPQGLLQLASLTPLGWDLEIIDENRIDIDFDKQTDLVGLTAMTSLAPRAYEIAKEYKRRGVTTIMGGIHASVMPNEAIKHVDCVVLGEADEIWPSILDDFKHGKLKKFYKPQLPKNLDFILSRKIKRTYPVKFSTKLPFTQKLAYFQTCRGCPNGCEFCSVSHFNGRLVRFKSIPYLMEEIENERKNNFDFVIFSDDNIMANKNYAKELFKALKSKNLRWCSQADIKIADPEVIDLARQSGLMAVFLGLESIYPTELKKSVGVVKEHWRPLYEVAIKRLHDYGIIVMASFIFGFDGENKDNINKTVEWAIKNKVDIAQFSILTALPGTVLFSKMEKEDRILTRDWEHYNVAECVIKPVGYKKEELEQEFLDAYKTFYSTGSIIRRLNNVSLSPAFLGKLLTNFECKNFKP